MGVRFWWVWVWVLTLSVEPSLNAREELAAGRYCGDDTRVR